MNSLSDIDVASEDLDCAPSTKAGKQQLSLLKCMLDKTCRSKTVTIHKAYLPTLFSSRKCVKTHTQKRTDQGTECLSSTKLKTDFLLGEQKEKSGAVTFSKVDSRTQVWPFENSAFGYDSRVYLHRDCTRANLFLHHASVVEREKVAAPLVE